MYICMRTTLNLDDELLSAAKRKAAEQDITLTAFVERALTAALLPQSRSGKRFKLRWKSHRGRLQPGVDISDRDSIFDTMEGHR